MSLRGNLKTMSLPDILQWIAQGQKTGTLHLERRSVKKRIIVRDGQIFSSWSNDPRESLGQFLIRESLVTEEQLFKALIGQEEKGRLIGSILVSEGILTEDDLRLALQAKAVETIYDLFLWPEGEFDFREGEFPYDVLIHWETPVTPVILEGIRRVDEWNRIRAVFPSMEVTFKLLGSPDTLEVGHERQAVELIGQGKTLAQIGLEQRRSDFDVAHMMFDLYQRGMVAVDQIRQETAGQDPIGAIQDLLTIAYQRLQEKRFDGAIKAYEQVLELDRLNQNAKKGLIAATEARSREKAMKAVSLGKVPYLTMDFAELTQHQFDSHEGFVISRVNGQWDVQSILKLCPMAEEDALMIFSRLLDRKVIELRDA
ncbi:MAG TPA: DUF4388 domain-containing protein [Vicinamibacteria bacterium]